MKKQIFENRVCYRKYEIRNIKREIDFIQVERRRIFISKHYPHFAIIERSSVFEKHFTFILRKQLAKYEMGINQVILAVAVYL